MNFPKRFLSPLMFLYGYYGVFFVLAPMFAGRYSDKMGDNLYILALAMSFSVLTFAVFGLYLGQKIIQTTELRSNFHFNTNKHYANRYSVLIIIFMLYVAATTFIMLIVTSSGGLQYWLEAPGDAFLNRGGSGIYVVASHFFTYLLAVFSGYYAYKYKKFYYIVLFLIWLVMTSPVHGSKAQISVFLILALLPWLKNVKPISLPSIFVSTSIIIVFFAGLYFRNVSWISLDTFLPYALDYFTTLENLVISVRDFEPSFMTTFFLPFNKFTTIFGNPDMIYYDMNHYLTDIYFPQAWEIRATEQWPVETDLYLNFGFFWGLPLIVLYFAIIGVFYSLALRLNGVGHWFISVLFMVWMVSHLRGSLYNHTDFYFYPMMIIMFYITKNYSFEKKNR